MKAKVRAILAKIIEKGRKLAAIALFSIAAFFGLVTTASASTPEIAITTDQLAPLVDYIVESLAVIMPIGITVMGIMYGIGIIPRVIKMFLHT